MGQEARTPVRIREAQPEDAAGIARVHVDSWRTTYRGLIPDAHLASLSYERREAMWRRLIQEAAPTYTVFVAEGSAGEIVGFADAGPERSGDPVYAGELPAIYLLEAYQHRGIGRQLMRAVADHLTAHGMETMLLWVLAANPARQFYEALGGRLVRSQAIDIGGATLEEVAYGWTDLSPLRSSGE